MGSASTRPAPRCGPPAPGSSSSPSSTEGVAARRILPKEAAIYVLNGLETGADPADYAAHRLKPAIGSAGELERWSELRRATATRPCAIHLDTGMSRLGFESLAALRRRRWTRAGRPAAPTC